MFATEGGGGREAGILSSCERFHSPLLNNCSEFSQLGLRGVSTPSPPVPVPRLMGRNERITLQDCRDISNGKGGRGGRFLFLLFFSFAGKKNGKRFIPLPLEEGSDRIIQGSPVNSNFQPFSFPACRGGITRRRALWRLSIVLLQWEGREGRERRG